MGQTRHGCTTIPHLTRSALHRCLQRQGISRLPDVDGRKPGRQWFKRYPIGFFHMDWAIEAPLVRETMARGIRFADQPRNRNTAHSRQRRFDMICEANGIEHRMTKPTHPWTNGQVERMNRTNEDATVKRFHSRSHDQLRMLLVDFMAAYNFARRLKTLSGLTSYEYICKVWTSEPDRFIPNPINQMPGLNSTLHSSKPAVEKGGRGRLIGRTKGGMNTKLHAVTDASGRPIRFFMTAGQVRDYTGARALLCSLPAAD